MKNKLMISLTSGLAVAVLALSACSSGPAGEESRTLRLGHPYPPAGLMGESAEDFAKAVEEATDGRVRIDVYASAQLGDHVQAASAMKEGRLDSYLLGIYGAGIEDPDSQVGALPYLVLNQAQADEYYFEDGVVAEIDRATLKKNGMHATQFLTQGFRGLTNSKRKVVLPSDVAGLKIRTPATPTVIESVTAWGASATSMPSGEYYAAMEQGVIDGQENGIDVTHSLKLWEVQDYFVDTNHAFGAFAITFSQSVWDTLSAEDQEAIEEVSLTISRQQRAALAEAEPRYYQEAAENGLDVTRLTDEQHKKWREATMSVTESYIEKMSPEVAAKVREILAKTSS